MIRSFCSSDIADIFRRLALLAVLSMGSVSATSLPDLEALPSSVAFEHTCRGFTDYSASASSVGTFADVGAALLHAKKELGLAKGILPSLDLKDNKAESYLQSVKGILDWLERDGSVNFSRDAATLASSLEAARLRLGDETTSLNHWLLVHNPEGREIEIPSRFIEVAVVEHEEEVINYDLDLLADSLV